LYKKLLIIFLCILIVLSCVAYYISYREKTDYVSGEYIKWVDFKIPSAILNKAYNYDVSSLNENNHIDWIELLARSATYCGGDFKNFKKIDEIANKIKNNEEFEENKYYSYYLEAYTAVLGGLVGTYYETDENGVWTEKYGLKAFSPIANGFYFSHYKDFGNKRSYGFKRTHLGNDLLGSVGTPIVAVESGVVEAIGWNRYGGWRIGIRSFDNLRYYYYAHLRKDKPYALGIKEGDVVKAGDVIGYLGMTGYSVKENVNNINIPHLHFGMQLIFDESQKDGNNEIWIDVYEIIEFLEKNKSKVQKVNNEYIRKKEFTEKNLLEWGG
jgi:murein DD-endopeptidase MepM/ murein hydrolase activator NlpD